MREIVTLQLGQQSNYVATHFWNTQESYFTYGDEAKPIVDHDVHWRGGIGADGNETFLPRTVVYDLKGGFGSLRKINALYDADFGIDAAAGAASLWPGKPELHEQQPLSSSEYQQSLDAGIQPAPLISNRVRYWSDYSRVYYHPKSLVQIHDYEVHSTIMPFERFSMGTALFQALDREHDLVDRDWRPFVEECDQMQGIQVFTTLDDAWGGFACSYLDALRDEYPKSCIWVWGSQGSLAGISREKRRLGMANVAQSLAHASCQASMVVPLAIPTSQLPRNVVLDRRSLWETSALLAIAAESAIFQSRLAPGINIEQASLTDMVQGLNVKGNQTLANLKMVVGQEASSHEDASLDMYLSQIGGLEAQTTKHNLRIFGQLLTWRGVGITKKEMDSVVTQNQRPIMGNPVLQRYTSSVQFPLLDSYPKLYTDVGERGGVQVHTSISTDNLIPAQMKSLRSQITWTMGLEDREGLVNALAEIEDTYQDGFSSGSDEDNDDS